MRNGYDYGSGSGFSPSSSPPTPPSPLPISVGPGNQKYSFSPSPSPSPPFSPAPSSHTSAENLPLLSEMLPAKVPSSSFSLDRPQPQQLDDDLASKSTSCLKDLEINQSKAAQLSLTNIATTNLQFSLIQVQARMVYRKMVQLLFQVSLIPISYKASSSLLSLRFSGPHFH